MKENISKINIVCSTQLYELLKPHLSNKKFIQFWNIKHEKQLLWGYHDIGIAISESPAALLKIMKNAKDNMATVFPIVICDDAKVFKSAEKSMLVLEKSQFASEADIFKYIAKIVESIYYNRGYRKVSEIPNVMTIDKEDLDLFLDMPGKMFFGYGRGDNFETALNSALESLDSKGDSLPECKFLMINYVANQKDYNIYESGKEYNKINNSCIIIWSGVIDNLPKVHMYIWAKA